jgi:hypothetical protein
MADFAKLRDHMVDVHLARRGIRDKRVLDAMRAVPRERFVREGLEEFAYEDSALPIEAEQTISSRRPRSSPATGCSKWAPGPVMRRRCSARSRDP